MHIHLETRVALDLYHQAVEARHGSFFWPTRRDADGTRHFVEQPDWGVHCPRCGSDVVILHGLCRNKRGHPKRHVICGDCYREWYSEAPGAVVFEYRNIMMRG